MTTQDTIVSANAVTKEFRQGDNVIKPLQGVDLVVQRGEFVALMGPSGSGKSTLLNLLIGIDHPTEGAIAVAGQNLADLSRSALARWRNRHLGVIFQQYHLVPVLTALENVELPLRLRKLKRRERRARAELAMEAVGLADRASHLPGKLSGGEQQRVAMARAFVTNPDLIVADEPTGNLDRQSVEGALTLLRRLKDEFGTAVVMVTHDMGAAGIADRRLDLKDGRLVNGLVPGSGAAPEARTRGQPHAGGAGILPAAGSESLSAAPGRGARDARPSIAPIEPRSSQFRVDSTPQAADDSSRFDLDNARTPRTDR